MSFLQPARRITDPDGREWEVYVSRFELMRPFLRMLATLPQTIARGLRSRQLRVEAVSFHPWPESHLWLTTRDHVARVVEQISAGLLVGEVARPLGSEFRGSQELVAETFRGRGPG